jgi:hypothetical protein
LIAIQAPTAGTYLVKIYEAAYGGDLDARYRLHIGRFARPTLAVPVQQLDTSSTRVRMLGDPLGEVLQIARISSAAVGGVPDAVALPAALEELQEVWPLADAPEAPPSPVPVRISQFPLLNEAELPTEQPPRPPLAVSGIVAAPGDRDRIPFVAERGETWNIRVWAAQIASPLDSVVTLFGPTGEVRAENDDHVRHDSGLQFTASESGEYAIEIGDHLNRGGPHFAYVLEVAPVTPAITLNFAGLQPALRPQSLPSATVPQGNRAALLAVVRRSRFAGPVTIEAEGLPPGVRMHCEPIDADRHVGLVLLEADEQARLGGALVSWRAVGHDRATGQKVVGTLRQEVGLTYGEPRQTVYHSVPCTQIPIVVAEAAPFRLLVESPPAPVVQDGRCDLVVRVERESGFELPISLTIPALPPWIEAPEEKVTVAAGESEVVLPLYAHSEAEPGRSWQLAVAGTCEGGAALLSVASSPFTLAVGKPLATAEIQPAAGALGQPVAMRCTLQWQQPFAGRGTATLRGLPRDCTATTIHFTGAPNAIEIPLQIGAETPPANHNSLYVELNLEQQGPMVHYVARGGAIEVLDEGAEPQERRSRLEVLRAGGGRPVPPSQR